MFVYSMRLLRFLFESGYFDRTYTVMALHHEFSIVGVKPLSLRSVLERIGTPSDNVALMQNVATVLGISGETGHRSDMSLIMYTEFAIFLLALFKGHDEDIMTFWDSLPHTPGAPRVLAASTLCVDDNRKCNSLEMTGHS